jgi:hypothetical protein
LALRVGPLTLIVELFGTFTYPLVPFSESE